MTAPAPDRPRWAPLGHVALAGLLGVLAAAAGFPAVVGAAFGGVGAALVTVAVLTALVCGLAVVLDRAAGPGRYLRAGAAGAAVRGVALGGLGSTGVLGLGLLALQHDLDSVLPDEALYAGAALPFAVVAALQWPGVPRLVGAVLVGATAVAGVLDAQTLTAAVRPSPAAATPAPPSTRAERVAEIGLDRRPWAADLPGHVVAGMAPGQVRGVYVVYAPGSGPATPDVMVSTLDDEAVPADDPCASPWVASPVGVLGLTSCVPVAPGVWERTGTPDIERYLLGGRDVVEQRDGQWIAVSGGPDVPAEVLRAALASSAPVTDDQLDAYLTSVGYPP